MTPGAGMGEGHDQMPDDPLLEELRQLFNRLDPVPERVDEGARAAFAWRTIDAELAELTRDSAVEHGAEPALVRAEGGPRLLSFESERFTLELEVTSETPQRLRLLGQIVPAARAEIEVQQESGTVSTEADDLGRFLIEGLNPGPARLRCRLPVADLFTQWTQL